jgi:hypothetical protein
LRNTARHAQSAPVDLNMHYVKAFGKTSARIFKFKAIMLACSGRTMQLGSLPLTWTTATEDL